ncbi:conserved hypothetical protein [uncultured Desulfobacterium sp.]|uniref:YprB ribonuclease H-like domain-containing protein n=1 Tax=uncultured Desulfobacterium sp. TaxID=201089 RepID=A0A445MRJ6_9BACT|nr:conserved hypothetical protein [uncultured Desulfobacterium sp.]
MLENTFIHIQGIGHKTERGLWRRGIKSWRQFLEYDGIIFSKGRDQFVRDELAESLNNLGNIGFFAERLSTHEMWRVFDSFREKAVYLDIETSGGYQGVDEITVIGIYDGHAVNTFVTGINLDKFEVAIAEYDLIVTFNGSLFDLPFIRRSFPNIYLPPGHIDLRFLLKRLGFAGGLKKIEKVFDIKRDPQIDGMSGYDAVSLWKSYQWGDRAALDTLIQYNRADIVNLEPLMEIAFDRMKTTLGLEA